MKRSNKRRFLVVVAMFFSVAGGLHANQDVAQAFNDAQKAIKAGKFDEGLAVLDKTVNDFPVDRALEVLGPRFGIFWYMKGTCEMQLGKFSEAIASFDVCHDKFRNDIEVNEEGAKVAKGTNKFMTQALLKAGQAAQKAEEWEVAIKRFKQFKKERDPAKDKFNEGIYNINLAICHFELGKLKEGLPFFEKALVNRREWSVPQTAILSCFRNFAGKALGMRNEGIVVGFVKKHQSALMVKPTEMATYALVFVKLGGEALQADLPKATAALYSLVPDTKGALDEIEGRLEALGGIKQKFQDGRNTIDPQALRDASKELKKRLKNATAPECYILPAKALLLERTGNVRAAYYTLQRIEEEFPKSEQRETNLYNLVRTSAYLEDVEKTDTYGQRFLRSFPDSSFSKDVRNMMLSGLYYSRDYEEGLKAANRMIGDLEEGTPQHDTCLFVQAACLYYLGRGDEAVEPIEQYLKLYKDSRFRLDARYIEASCQIRLQNWQKGALLLDKMLEDYPNPEENRYYAYILLDRANCYYTEDESEEAIKLLTRIEKEFPSSSILDNAYNLRGTIEEQENPELAEAYFVKAYEAAKRMEHPGVKAEAIFYLVRLLGDKDSPNKKKALPYYEEFWKEHAESFFGAQMAVAGMPAMKEAGRSEEALQRLQEVISRMAKVPGSPGMEAAINSYTEAYLEIHSPEELREHFYSFPGIEPKDKAANAMLRVAIIGVFQEQQKKLDPEKDDREFRRIDAMTKALFSDLKNDFELKDLTNFILYNVGDYLREKSNSPKEAIPFYEEILERDDPEKRFEAHFGIADIYGSSANKADTDKALKSLELVIADANNGKMERKAFFRTMQIRHAREEWDVVIKMANEFFESGQQNNVAEVSFMMAEAYDGQGQVDEAINMYSRTWLQHKGYLRISAPSIKRLMELLWERNKEANDKQVVGDRQLAYDTGWKYLEMTRRAYKSPKVTDGDKKLWEEVEKLVLDYEARGGIKSMEAQLKEKK